MTQDTGYEGGGQDEGSESIDPVHFTLVETPFFSSAQVVASLLRNGESCGLIYLKSKEEFDWLKERVTGTFNITDVK